MTTLKLPGSKNPLEVESILWIEGDGNYAWVHCADSSKLLSSQTLKWFENQLPSFVRVHKSSLVNTTHVVLFDRISLREARVVLRNGTALLVSRRRVQSIADLLKEIAVEAQFASLTV